MVTFLPATFHGDAAHPGQAFAWIAHFIAAAFLTNGIPHFVNGVSGRRFRIPFAQAAKYGSPTANVVRGWANFLIAFLLFAQCRAALYIGTPGDAIFVAFGMLVTGILLDRIFEGNAI